jgi:hypothetical protein
MRALTILVAVMGVVILVGFAVVIATIAGRLARRDGEGPQAFSAAITIPKGARVAAMTTGENRLVLRLELPGGGQEILILDLASGRPLGTIALAPAP